MINNNITLLLALCGVTAALFSLFGYIFRKYTAEKKVRKAENRAQQILLEADKEVANRRRELEIESKNMMFNLRQEFERETKDRKQELFNLEKRIIQREENLDRKVDILERKEKDINNRERNIVDKERAVESVKKDYLQLISEEKEKLQILKNGQIM